MQEFKKKVHGSGTATLIISDEEMNDTTKIIPAIEDSNILLKGVTKTIKNETKEQKGGGALGASLSGNLLTGKGIVRTGTGKKKGKGILRVGSENKKGKGIVRARIFEIQKYKKNELMVFFQEIIYLKK